MYEANENFLSHIDGLDVLTANADAQAFETLGQGVGENTLDDTSKTETAGWIKTHMAGFIGMLGAGVLLIGLVILFILAKRKLNQYKKNKANYEQSKDNENVVNKKDKPVLDAYYKIVDIMECDHFAPVYGNLNKCIGNITSKNPQTMFYMTTELLNSLNSLADKIDEMATAVSVDLQTDKNDLKKYITDYFVAANENIAQDNLFVSVDFNERKKDSVLRLDNGTSTSKTLLRDIEKISSEDVFKEIKAKLQAIENKLIAKACRTTIHIGQKREKRKAEKRQSW